MRSFRLSSANSSRRTLFASLAILGLTFLVLADTVEACQGRRLFPVCNKTLNIAIAGPPVLTTDGGTVDVPALVFFDLNGFPPAFAACPGGPFSADLTVTATCSPGPNGSGQLLAQPVTLGAFSTFSIPLVLPAGPPRLCQITATVTLSLADGMQLSEDAKNVVCVLEPAPSDPSLPRLDLEILTGNALERVHPGDQNGLTYRITNNDPGESFTGVLTLDSVQEARQPTATGPMPPGTGAVSVSDPVQGDNFPVAFLDELIPIPPAPVRFLAPGCVALGADPTIPYIPTKSRPITVGPASTLDIQVFARPWGMCANGSCGRSALTLDGQFSDLTTALACGGFVTAADTSVPPSYAWPDAGKGVLVQAPPNPENPLLPLLGQPSPDLSVPIEILSLPLLVEPFTTATPTHFSSPINDERGRIQTQIVDTFAVDSFFDVFFDITIQPPSASTIQTELIQLDLQSHGPTGFEQTDPFVMGRVLAHDTVFMVDSFFDITFQISGVGIQASGDRLPLVLTGINFQRKIDGTGLTAQVSGSVDAGGSTDDLIALEMSMDLRGFISPEPQDLIVFTDGFESGNVSQWSRTVPAP